MSNLKYWLWLSGRRSLMGQPMIQVLEHFGTPEHIYFSDPEEYRLLEGLPAGAVESLRDKSLSGAEQILEDCDRLGLHIMTMQDARYPERLKAIHQPPLVLYWKGREVAFDEEAAVTLVGTRNCTPYGERMAARLAMDLTRGGALVVSGMAQGIDSAALRGALQAGGPVVSVLGNGIDVIYPKANRRLYEDVGVLGTLISEHPPGTQPSASAFPIRNRLLSGLSVGMIAVESRKWGGTLSTVNHALEQNRDVFAVPGPADAPASVGTNRLIQEGAAQLILDADDVLCELAARFPGRLGRRPALSGQSREARVESVVEQGEKAPNRRPGAPKPEPVQAEKEVDNCAQMEYIDWKDYQERLTDDQRDILLALHTGELVADDIAEQTGLPARRVLSALTVLQIQGLVREESGRRFCIAVKLKME